MSLRKAFGMWLIATTFLLAAASCAPSPTTAPDTPTPIIEPEPATDTPIPTTAAPPTTEPDPTPGSTATDTPAETQPSPESTPLPSDPIPDAPGERAQLSVDGPWLLFIASAVEEGLPYLWGVNSDGSGLGRLSEKPVLTFAVYPGRTADGTSLVAMVSTSPEDVNRDLTLNLLTLPAGTESRITALTWSQTGLAPGESSNEKMDIAAGISHHEGLRWSPDGRWLAFAGAMDGPSVDLYSYELATGTIRWLTDGPSHAYQLLWTADSNLILHSARDYFLGAGGPYEAGNGIWGARPDGSETITYEGPAGARFVGWQDDTHLLIDSGPRNGCLTGVRVLDLTAGIIESKGLNCFIPIAYDNSLQFALTYNMDNQIDRADWGIVLVNLNTGESIDVANTLAYEIYWDDHAQLFIMTSDFGISGVTLAGEMVEAPPRTTMPSPDNRFAVHYALPMSGEGVSISQGNSDPIKVLGEDGRVLGWAPDGSGLFVIALRSDLYLVSAETMQVTQLSADLWSRIPWQMPDNLWLATWAP